MSRRIKKEDRIEWDNFLDDLMGKHATRASELLDDLTDKQFMVAYPKLLEFAAPKTQRREVTKNITNQMNVLQIQYVNSPEEIEEYRKQNEIEEELLFPPDEFED